MRNSTIASSTWGSLNGTALSRTRSAAPSAPPVPPTAGRLPQRVVCSLYDTGKIDSPVGACFVHFATGEVSLISIWDSQTYVRTFHKMTVHDPSEVVVTSKDSKLHAILMANIDSGVKVAVVDKKHFGADSGMGLIKKVSFESDLNYLVKELAEDQAALSALSGAFHYISTLSHTPVHYNHWRVKHERLESFVNIDVSTIRSLDLITNSLEKNGLSVFKFLNSTLSKMGERSLKTNLLQPLTDKESIEERLKSVSEFTSNPETLQLIREELKGSQDLDKLFTLLLLSRNQAPVANSTQKVNDIILVKQAVTIAHKVSMALQDCTSPLLQQIQNICSHDALKQVKACIDESINEDCAWESGALDLKNQQCYAVKAGRNGLLDVSRQVYKVVIDEIVNIINTLAEEHGLNLEQSYNTRRGFFIKLLDYKSLDHIPDVFINRAEKKKHLECTTLDIVKCNARLEDSMNEILMLSDKVIESLIQDITGYLPVLFMLAEALGTLDFLQCLAYNALKNNYVCPEFSSATTLKSSRHPVLEILVPNFIPNDICCIQDVSRFQVITGTNMSGKSVYLRQVALLTIMAQMGSFVPADFASFRIFDCIRARISVDTNTSNISTFAAEMSEMVCILEDIDENSLVIIDELGRGSSIHDAFAISLSICEHLVDTGATVLTSTHFHELSSSLATRQGVMQNHMSTEMAEADGSITMNFRLTNGMTEAKRYGIKIARNFFSEDIVQRANEISRALEGTGANKEETEQMRKDKRFINLVAVLRYICEGDISVQLLRGVQDEFLG